MGSVPIFLFSPYAEKCNFEGALMNSSELQGANLYSSIGLTKEQIESAIIDRRTTLPGYLMDDPKWYEEQIKRSEKWLSENHEV